MASTQAGSAPARVWVDDRHPVFRRGIASLLATVRAVAAGNTTLPSDLVPRLLARAAHEAGAGSRVLSDREMAVLRLLSEGNDTCQIGDTLGYSERTVKNIVHDMLMKMNCRNRVHAVALATREGLI